MFPAGSRNLAVILGAFHHRFTRAKAVCERRSECLGRNCWQIRETQKHKTSEKESSAPKRPAMPYLAQAVTIVAGWSKPL